MASSIVDRPQHRAPRVCFNCKTRKRACDKIFPSCSYCSYRGLVCRYVTPNSLPEVENKNHDQDAPSYREFVLSLKAPTTSTTIEMESFRVSCSSTFSTLTLADKISDSTVTSSLSFSKRAESLRLDGILHDKAHSIIQATGQFIDDITTRYFRGIHEWIPVISRRRFQDRLINSSAPAPKDFSVLLLSMCLITYQPSRVNTKLIDQDEMYFTTKMLFAYVQEFISSSINLIEAGILISMYEYAHGKLSAAYSSIVNCAKMARVIGLHDLKSSLDLQEDETLLERQEKKNIWRAIIIYERVIFCDIISSNQLLTTKFPNNFESSLSEPVILDQNEKSHVRTITFPAPSTAYIKQTTNLTRQIQATYFVDQVFNIINIADIKMKLLEMSKIDKDLMAFLSMLLETSFKTGEHNCVSIAICIRALRILHCHELGQASVGLEDWEQHSTAALNTISKIVVDIADYYNKQYGNSFNIDISSPPPPTTFYIIQTVLKHLDLNPHLERDLGLEVYKTLRKFSAIFCDIWNIK